MKNLAILLIVCLMMSCTSIHEIKVKSLERVNETRFIYPISFNEISKKSDMLFSYKAQKENKIRLSGSENTALLYSKVKYSSDDRIEIQLGDVARSFWDSDFYRVNGRAAQTTGVFTVKFEPTDGNQTLVSVEVDKLEVINGIDCCGPHGRYSRYTRVASTTIEEYAILFYLGEQFGVNMHKPYRPDGG